MRKGRVIFFAYGGNQYSCNPRYISDYILSHDSEKYDVFWLFERKKVPDKIDRRIKIVRNRTINAMIAINTSEFVITNKRTNPWQYAWVKKKKQKYIMTWHGGKPLKKIEMDAIDSLGTKYLQKMRNDSAYCDLFLSDCAYTSNLYHKCFLYDGEILEKGLPRNDIFFSRSKHFEIRKKVFEYFGFEKDDKIVLYAPTFRGNMEIECYNIDWSRVILAFERKLNGKVNVLIRLHPNFLSGNIDRSTLLNIKNVYDATNYDDINDLIISSDVMISDYSSCMFDFTFMKRPIFIYATDSNKYERGFYIDIRQLPFPFAENNNELVDNINTFDEKKYQMELRTLMEDFFCSYDTGNAAKAVVEWMKSKSI